MAYKMDLDKRMAPKIPKNEWVVYYEEAKPAVRGVPEVLDIMMTTAVAAKRKIISHDVEHFINGIKCYRITMLLKPIKKKEKKKEGRK